MKMRKILALVMALAMMLVCLPIQTHAEEQAASLMPKKFEQLKTITELEEGVITFTEPGELASLCAQAQADLAKEYLCVYIGGSELHIAQNLTIPENMLVAVYSDLSTNYIYIEPGATVELQGYMEATCFINKGTFRISSTGMLYTPSKTDTAAGVIYNSGTIVSEGGYAYGVVGAKNIHNEGFSIVQLSGSLYNQKDLIQSCEQAEERNDGHWLYFFEAGNYYMPFDSMTVTIPSNYNLSIDKPQKIANSEMDVYGSVECTADVVFNGEIRIHPSGMLGIGAKFTMQGALENYGDIAIAAGVDDFFGSLMLSDPQTYKDVKGSNLGRIIVVAKAGAPYPTYALVEMNVNDFSVEWYQEEGLSYWVLTNYKYSPYAPPEPPVEVTLLDSGDWDNGAAGNTHWEIYSDGTLKISGKRYMKEAYNQSYPWKIYAYMIKRIEVSDIEIIAKEAFRDMPILTSISIGDTVVSIGTKAFANCPMLESITIPAKVQVIGTEAFSGCKNLKEVTFAENSELQSMPGKAFSGTAIAQIIVPAKVDYIQENAFVGMDKLEKITFTGNAPGFSQNAFGAIYFQVPAEDAIDAYYPWQNATWDSKVAVTFNGAVNWVPYCYEHTYTTKIVEPDCINPGAIMQECSVCGDIHPDKEVLAPLGHDYGLGEDGNPDFWDTTCDVCGAERKVDKHRPTHSMYRMYNPNSGEHFYTGSMEERKVLEAAGWKYEGVGFTFPATTGKPVYRLYDKDNTMEHLYTMDEAEKDMLLAQGWVLEGVAFNSGREDEVPQYRLHNPNATIGAYHFTASREEKDALIAAGWEYQGIGFYTCLQ